MHYQCKSLLYKFKILIDLHLKQIFEYFNRREIHGGKRKSADFDCPPEVDLWSTAVTLYEASTGQMPFFAMSKKSMLKLLTQKPLTAIRGCEGADKRFYYADSLPNCRRGIFVCIETIVDFAIAGN